MNFLASSLGFGKFVFQRLGDIFVISAFDKNGSASSW